MPKKQTNEQPSHTPASSGPAATVRLGNLKMVLWRNEGERGPWYVADLVRTFKNEAGFQDTNKVNAEDLLRVAYLANKAYGELQQLKAQDKASSHEIQDESFDPR